MRAVLALILSDRIMVAFQAQNFFSSVVGWRKEREYVR
jgi:hypothetical protein